MTATAREQIGKLLGDVGSGSFTARRPAAAGDLVLAVKGVGPLRLPIPREQAQQLLRSARPARYGRREQTLLDRRVRDTGEIPASRVKIDRRRWNRTLLPMLAALGADLGLAPGQRLAAELHGMLVYGPGQFFKQHQDSERADGMVGTLVVTLPSTFTGGAIVVEHQGDAVTYRATKQPLSFIAFYADCRHEIRRVRTGYRIVLTYDLILEGEATAAEAPAGTVGALAPLLREHFTTPLPASPYRREDAPPREPPSRLVYLLDHQYTARGLGWRRLKGNDAARAAALRAAAERAGCEVVLALAEVHETRDCQEDPWDSPWYQRHRSWQRDEDDDWLAEDEPPADDPDTYMVGDLLDWSVTLERWIDDASGGAAEPILTTVADHEVCATTPSSALAPHTAEYEGYMGNYGNTMDRWYRRAALVLWPRERAFAVRAEASPGWALKTLALRLRAGGLRESREMAASLLAFWSDVAAREEHRGLFAQALRVAASLESPRLAAALLLPFQLESVTPPLAPDFAALVARYGEAWTRNLLDGWANSTLDRMRAGGRDMLAWLTSLRPLCEAVRAAASPVAVPAARLLVQDGWRALQQEVAERRGLFPPSQRERALAALAKPILGWLGGAAVVEADEPGQPSPGATAPGEGWIARGVSYLCAGENGALVPCLVKVLRAAAKAVEPARRGALGLDTIARHCGEELAAHLAPAPRAQDDWSVALPAGCHCALCRKLGAFLSDPAQQRLEWPLAKQGRQHVHSTIDHHELPVRHQTRRLGSPYTLVLEKTKALFAREATARRAWRVDLDWLASAGGTGPEAVGD
ncbi:MAG TPA: 2OG-Fe(II) oxygenase [Thermoanaerobaculia bacterium]|nr:2OG-Fe(II) oxygenase [Thermoanaerobaculia bacterium]